MDLTPFLWLSPAAVMAVLAIILFFIGRFEQVSFHGLGSYSVPSFAMFCGIILTLLALSYTFIGFIARLFP